MGSLFTFSLIANIYPCFNLSYFVLFALPVLFSFISFLPSFGLVEYFFPCFFTLSLCDIRFVSSRLRLPWKWLTWSPLGSLAFLYLCSSCDHSPSAWKHWWLMANWPQVLPIVLHKPPCKVNLPLVPSRAKECLYLLWSELGSVVYCGQWNINKSDTSRGLRSTSALRLALSYCWKTSTLSSSGQASERIRGHVDGGPRHLTEAEVVTTRATWTIQPQVTWPRPEEISDQATELAGVRHESCFKPLHVGVVC